MTAWQYIGSLADASILAPFLLYLYYFKVIKGEHKMLIIFILATVLRNLLAASLEIKRAICECVVFNLSVYNWHNLISYICFSMIYYHVFISKRLRWFSVLTVVLLLPLAWMERDSLLHFQTNQFSEYSFIGSRIFSIIILLLFFYELITHLNIKTITEDSIFWFSAGALLYYAGTLFPYLFIKYTFGNNNAELAQQYWMIDAFLSILFSVALSFSVWYMRPKTASFG